MHRHVLAGQEGEEGRLLTDDQLNHMREPVGHGHRGDNA